MSGALSNRRSATHAAALTRNTGRPPTARLSVLAVVTLTLMACSEEKIAKDNALAPTVGVSQPLRRTITEWDEFTGRFQAIHNVQVRARVSGYLQSAHFREGSIVKKGDLLYVIDPRPYEAAAQEAEGRLANARSQVELAEREVERAAQLSRTQAVSAQVVDQRRQALQAAQAAVTSAEGALTRARLDVEFTRIQAPVDGRIGRRLITEGNLVSGGETGGALLTTIVSLDPIYFYFSIDEQTYIKNTRLFLAGQRPTSRDTPNPVQIALPDDGVFRHDGRMDWVDNELDAGTGTLRGRAVLDNPQLLFTPGQFGRVRLVGSAPYDAILLPDQAIGSDQSRKIVFILGDNNVVASKEVKLGPLVDGLRVIREGLRPDELVVVSGLQRARVGARVTPEPKPLAQTSVQVGEGVR